MTGCGGNSIDFQDAASKNAAASLEIGSRPLPFTESTECLSSQVWVNMELEDTVTASDKLMHSNLGKLLYAEKEEIIHILNAEIPMLDEQWTDNIVLGIPWIRLSLMDITNDGIPEFFVGGINMKNGALLNTYSFCCGHSENQQLEFYSGGSEPIFDGKVYLPTDGQPYFVAKLFTGTAVQNGFRVTKIWYTNEIWNTEITEYWEEEYINSDTYMQLPHATVDISNTQRECMPDIVDQCIQRYLLSCQELDVDFNAQYTLP